MKVTVGSNSNTSFQPATDRGSGAAITVNPPAGSTVKISTVGGAGAGLAYDQANIARSTANSAYGQANAAYNAANSAKVTVYANSGAANATTQNINFVNTSSILVTVANTNGNANISFAVTGAAAGDAYDQANAARDQANTALNVANGAYNQANGAYAQANVAYSQANSAYNQANDAYSQANTARVTANDAYSQANAGYLQANTARDVANGAYAQANGAYAQANGAYAQANGAYDQANGAYGQANGAYSQANAAYAHANIVYNQANAAYGQANSAYGQANDAYDQANTARSTANDSYQQANVARTTANDAYIQANNAYAEANLKLNITGGTINGSLNVSGNLSITGNTIYYNVTTYTIDDPLIYLAANNDTSDLVDIGFMGGKNTAGIYSHTGLVRDAGDGTWHLFDNLAEEGHENNVVDFANTTLATLRANIAANSILLVGNVVATQANLTIAFNQANTARTTANDAYGQANSARNQANASYGQANSARDQANTARDQANTARNQANAAYADSNTRVLKSGDTMTGQLNISSGGLIVTGNITTTGASGDISGVNTIYAGTFSTTAGLNVTAQAANAYDQANNARNQANTARDTANASYGAANTANTIALNAYAQANAAYDAANNAQITVFQNNASGITTQNLNFVNTSSVTVSVENSGGNANISFTSIGGAQDYSYNTTSTSTETVDSWSTTVFRSGKYQVQVSSSVGYLTCEIALLHAGNLTNMLQYGNVSIGAPVGVFTSDVNNGNVRLRFAATDITTRIRYIRSLIINDSGFDPEVLPTDLMTGIDTYDLMEVLFLIPTDLNA